MRIGVYDPYLDDLGGGEKYMMSIASCLTDKNNVDVFWDWQKDVDAFLQRFHVDLSKVKIVKNIFLPTINLLSRLIATKPYDTLIVLSDGSIPLVASRQLFLHIQQPLESAQTESLWGKLKMKRVSKVFCNSLYTKKFVDSTFHTNSEIIYPPVSIHEKKVKKENVILHVGRFRAKNIAIGDYKKQSVMVDTFKEMVKNGLKNWKLVLAVGVMQKDEKEFEKMRDLAKGFPIEFAINKSNDALWALYSK